MAFKIVIGNKGKSWKLETESEALVGKSLGDKADGKEIKAELEGYEMEIKGGSDQAGFPMYKEVEGIGLKRVLFSKGWGMHDKTKGLRLRKTVRGKTISPAVSQINLMVIKEGGKKLEEVFPEQNKAEQSSAVPSASTEGQPKAKKEAPKAAAPAA
jgi:small subunit ribosomal protein S6e